ncbi:hypothetical protein ACVH4A_11080 [Klebsiella pneumoniae]|uniref:hypothetical protein n=1 Tax=Klebsiella pneumoniae TaxID=573 RepID=UPI00190E1350|nr:hypothetical protein [Klebsiella pneumoniae]HDT3365871.1 hypothetical protein [Klebsiella pneumoniae subsp. pneumoniae]MBQ5043977.1 hypothetical protein [Klebsiella pneumoniae]MBQ5071835.1 hypothetical protein [Klebsiella pneumoniae]MBQ5265892.1 hypothetical protein [Klebsiella pneumoniae]MDH1944621.1 hypothetical protein [Klebsiella pneumoniae]
MNELVKLTADVEHLLASRVDYSGVNAKRSPNNPDDARSRAARKCPNRQSLPEHKKSYHKQYAYNEFMPFEYAD